MTDGWCVNCNKVTERYSMVRCAKCDGHYAKVDGKYDCKQHDNVDYRTDIIYKQTQEKNGRITWVKVK